MNYNDIKTLDETTLLNFAAERIVRDNPHLTRGDDLTSPVGLVHEGKLLSDSADLEDPTILAKTIMIHLSEFLSEDTKWTLPDKNVSWIHFYQLIKPPMLDQLILNKESTVLDPITFEPHPIIVTQQMIDNQGIYIRYGTK